jgi:hypothetical protein
MTLLGLHRAVNSGLKITIETEPVLERLLTGVRWIDQVGDLGLLIWLCAETAPARLADLFARFQVLSALERFEDAREQRTMELAWFLTGLASAKQVAASNLPDITDLAVKTFRLLMKNCGRQSMFAHLGNPSGFGSLLRAHIGTFADQVYPIIACARFAAAFAAAEALDLATNCAEMICRFQGPKGQWWWHYDSRRGQLAAKYPVFSVQQHGMAPMALLAMADISSFHCSEEIHKGLGWIAGENELEIDLRVSEEDIIWRSIHQSQYAAYSSDLFSMLRLPQSARGLRLRTECRPYELGWLLYAFAGR